MRHGRPDRRHFIAALATALAAALVALLLPATSPLAEPHRRQADHKVELPGPVTGAVPPRWVRTGPTGHSNDAATAPIFGEPPPDPPPPPDLQDATWWLRAWSALLADDFAEAHPHTAADSALVLLLRLGVAPDLAGRARPDSALAARFRWLALRDGYLPAELLPLLQQMGRAEDYRDLASRAAAMYDEFLQLEIVTPD